MLARERPQYSSRQSAPAASTARTMGSSGVMPMPPATKTYDSDSASGKRLRGPRNSTSAPGRRAACTSREPPRPSATRRAATV